MARAPADDNDQPLPEDPPLPRVSRHIQPVGPRVLVRIVKEADRSEAGLFLPAGVKESNAAALLGEVVEVARTLPKAETSLPDEETDEDEDEAAVRVDLGRNVSGIPLGANVLFEKERGVTVPWDEALRILEVRHVLALVDIIPQDEIQ
jgi:co-chaperonin GroES (HSP10)